MSPKAPKNFNNLSRPENFREIKKQRVCGTCRWLKENDDGTVGCIRPSGPAWDIGYCTAHFFWTCDLWEGTKK